MELDSRIGTVPTSVDYLLSHSVEIWQDDWKDLDWYHGDYWDG